MYRGELYFPGFSRRPDIDSRRSEEDLEIIRRRQEFKRVYGNSAKKILTTDPAFSDKLTGLTRRQKRAISRSATDFAAVAITGETIPEERFNVDRVTDRSRQRFEMSDMNEAQIATFTDLAQTASQNIVEFYKK